MTKTYRISRNIPLRRASLALFLALAVAGSLLGCRARPDAEIAPRPTHSPTPAPDTGPDATPEATPTPPISPTPPPTRVPPESTAISYTVRPGDTLIGIAMAFGTTPERLMEINGLLNGDVLAAGQVLQVTLAAQHVGPEAALIPDSEAVYGPTYADFDLAARAEAWPGLLSAYTEMVGGVEMTGPEIVQQIAEQYGVGPRVLLALLELRGGWLSDPDPAPAARTYPLGYAAQEHWDSLHTQLSIAANALNAGFYGWLEDDLWLIQTEDGTYIQFAPTLNAGTAGVQRALAGGAEDYETFVAEVARFDRVYRRLFGDPFARTIALIPPDLEAPEMALPWPEDETWYYTGGPHGGWGTGSAWAALDFVSDERDLGCWVSQKWATAAASGPVIISREGEVWQDLDG
ncbi:MAG: LysM peptidoglycan-binding domain-containing protein, partial [Anaerolineales bacterium]